MRTFVVKLIGFVTLIAFVGGISIDGQLTVIKNGK